MAIVEADRADDPAQTDDARLARVQVNLRLVTSMLSLRTTRPANGRRRAAPDDRAV